MATVKLLLFSDLHADLGATRRLVTLARNADVLVGAGDFGNLRRDVQPCIDFLAASGKPAILVAGNNESTDELVHACRHWSQATVLHGSGASVLGVSFWGLGGGVPVTPFGSWSYDFSEDEAEKLLTGCPKGAVLVSHSPPFGAVDLSSRGQHLGSRTVRDALVRVNATLTVCGHIHGSAGQVARIDGRPVVNAGPHGMLWDVPAHT